MWKRAALARYSEREASILTEQGRAPPALLERHAMLLDRDTNHTLARGMLVCALMGYSAAAILSVLQWVHIIHSLTIPVIWAAFGGTVSIIVYALSKRNRVRGKVRYLVAAFFSSMPTWLFIVAHFLMPSGAATYITGPASYLYFFFIIMTGFFFDSRVPIFAGVLAAIQYVIAFYAGRAHLADLKHPDPQLLQDFVSAPIYFFKAQMMVFSGVGVGVIANHARKMIARILAEEESRREIDRLFGQYVSAEVKEKLLSRTHENLSERKHVVVLFADIRDYSTLSEDRDPESLVLQLNEYLNCMVNSIQREGGVIDKFIGDAVMATFGGVLDMENPCESAVRAAHSMLEELQKLNGEWQKKNWPAFRIGIGLHYGEVLQGSIGSEHRKEFTVIGDTVNTASRLESLTKDRAHPILVSDEIVQHLSPELKKAAKDLGPAQVKGKARQVKVYGFG